jgi:hypothetical protein
MVEWMAPLIRFWEVLGTHLDPKALYAERFLVVLSFSRQIKC